MTTTTTTKKTKTGASEGDLQALAKEFAQTARAIHQLKLKHPSVFNRLSELETNLKQISNEIRDSARTYSVPGSTITLVDTTMVQVTVTGPLAAPTYDLERARKYWPAPVVQSALVEDLDTKIVESMVASGSLPEKAAAKARRPQLELSPAVKIKLIGDLG